MLIRQKSFLRVLFSSLHGLIGLLRLLTDSKSNDGTKTFLLSHACHSSHSFTFRSPVEKETFMLSSLQEIFCVNCPEQCQELCIWLTGCVRTMIILCVCVFFFSSEERSTRVTFAVRTPPPEYRVFQRWGSLQALGFLSDRCLIA